MDVFRQAVRHGSKPGSRFVVRENMKKILQKLLGKKRKRNPSFSARMTALPAFTLTTTLALAHMALP